MVCSAGNDATTRPSFPAAFGPWSDGSGPVVQDPDVLPIVSVGALNPNATTDALFSNAGPWVRAHEIGANVISTIPTTFDGGYQAGVETEHLGRTRASLDPDDYSGGFATWSGTSFAAPLLAGKVAQWLLDHGQPGDSTQDKKRVWSALEALTTLKPLV